jgi:ornithine carbamoyltransferase
MTEAVKDADVVYAKSWGPLVTDDQTEGQAHPGPVQALDHRQRLMALAKEDASTCTRCRPTATSK